jgi:hypothetical protein
LFLLHVLRYELETKDLRQALELRQKDVDQWSLKADRRQQLVTYQKTVQAKLLTDLAAAQEIAQKVDLAEAQLTVSNLSIISLNLSYRQKTL